jgi:hypothetical protein
MRYFVNLFYRTNDVDLIIKIKIMLKDKYIDTLPDEKLELIKKG